MLLTLPVLLPDMTPSTVALLLRLVLKLNFTGPESGSSSAEEDDFGVSGECPRGVVYFGMEVTGIPVFLRKSW